MFGDEPILQRCTLCLHCCANTKLLFCRLSRVLIMQFRLGTDVFRCNSRGHFDGPTLVHLPSASYGILRKSVKLLCAFCELFAYSLSTGHEEISARWLLVVGFPGVKC